MVRKSVEAQVRLSDLCNYEREKRGLKAIKKEITDDSHLLNKDLNVGLSLANFETIVSNVVPG